MKKLAIVLFLVVAACQRKVAVTSAPALNTPGAATPREAVQLFMAAAKTQDLQAMSNIWGSAAGPARSTMNQQELEQRQIIIMRCVKHDTYSIVGENPIAGGNRVFVVEIRLGTLTPKSNFTAIQGPANRWYLLELELQPLRDICVAK